MPDPINLPRLYYGWKDNPQILERYWDDAMRQIETLFEQILSLPTIQEEIETLRTDLETVSAISSEQLELLDGNLSAQQVDNSLRNSYIVPISGEVITADETGLITVTDHTRVYGDSSINPNVLVQGTSIVSAALPGDIVRVYYRDPNRQGGAVTYEITIDPAIPLVQEGEMHSVGVVEVPTLGEQAISKHLQPSGFVSL